MLQLSLSTGEPVIFKPAPVKTFRGLRLPGADLLQAKLPGLEVMLHRYSHTLFSLQLLQFHSKSNLPLQFSDITTDQSLRFEAVLRGTVQWAEGPAAGQYRLAANEPVTLHFDEGESSQVLLVGISDALLAQTPVESFLAPGPAAPMPPGIQQLIQSLFENVYSAAMRAGFYDHCVRELLFLHAALPPYTAPGGLNPKELSAVHAAHHIIASNIQHHYSLETLAKMTQSNTQVIKRGFRQLFGMGTFERLQVLKMEHAKMLLETTDKQVQEVAELAGYETATGFINAFRKKFGMTPRDWRMRGRGEGVVSGES